jgi:hypothetical protein
LAKCFEERVANEGVEQGLRYLKGESSRHRAAWILNQAGEVSAQTSFIGRALPVGTEELMLLTASQHKADMTSVFRTDTDILRRAEVFAERWARRNLDAGDRLAATGVPTLSSCSENTVGKGGLRGFAASLGMHPEAIELTADEYSRLPPQDVQSVANDLSLLLHGRDLLDKGLPPSTFIALRERGLKVRGITKSPAGLHFLGHVVRKRLLAGLRRCPPCRSTLAGLDDEDLVRSFVGASADVVVSTDLTRATDLIPHDLVSAMINGLEASGKVTPMEVQVLRVLSGPQKILYPSLGGLEVISSRGILMGLPTSWAMLSLLHLFWWEDSIAQVAGTLRLSRKSVKSRNRYAICGDDSLFCGTVEVAHQYSRLIESTGGLPSEGKHFECRRQTRPRAVFVERLYEFSTDGTLITGGARNGAIPLRGLVRPENPEVFRELGSKLSICGALKSLLSVDSIWRNHPAGLGRLLNFLSGKRGKALRAAAASFGLPDGIHLYEGGSGLPSSNPDPSVWQLRYRAALGKAIGVSLPSVIKGSLDSLWQMAEMCVVADLDAFYAGGTFRKVKEPLNVHAFSGAKWPPRDKTLKPPDLEAVEFVFCGTPESLQAHACASMYCDLVLQMGVPAKAPRLSLKGIQRSRRKWLALLPEIPEGADLGDLSVIPRFSVYVQRTRGPDGTVLYPRWVGESSSSEARLRASLFARAWGSRNRSPHA